jgi:alkylated DNA nucleotide flippase Atl1
MARVTHLFKKLIKGEPITSFDSKGLICKSRYGIEGDINADKFTPRQVLITCEENLRIFSIKPGDLKENIVIKGYDVDSLHSGSVIKIGEVEIRITFNCEPCSYVETVRKGLAKDIHGKRGVLGVVLTDGEIKVGDEFIVLEKKFDAVPFNVADRFKWFIDQIPEGKITTYTQIIKLLGLFSVYYRVIPTYIKKCSVLGSPVHRVIDSSGELILTVEDQLQKLNMEGVKVVNNKVDLEKYSWDPSDIYYK